METAAFPDLFDSLQRTHLDGLRMVCENMVYELNELLEQHHFDFGKGFVIRITAHEIPFETETDYRAIEGE